MCDGDRESVRKLRKLMKVHYVDDTQITDFDLIRWIDQFYGDLDAAVVKIAYAEKLMKCMQLKNYHRDPVVEEYWPGGVVGPTGIDNNLLYVEPLGLLDYTGMFKTVSFSKIFLTRVSVMEGYMAQLRSLEKSTGKLSRFAAIVDFENFKFDRHMVSFLTIPYKNYFEFFTTNYGDIYEKFICINMPKNICSIYKLIRPLLPELAHKKIVILGPDWKTEILKHVHPNYLPAYLGGTLVDALGDPKCSSTINFPPGKIPHDLYWHPDPAKATVKNLPMLEVPRGKFRCMCIDANANDTLTWFFAANGKFYFGVYFTEDCNEENTDNMEMVYPVFYYTLATHVPESNQIICKKSGIYKMWISNECTWFYTLKVHYKVEVIANKTTD